jgi:hypothetical protein
MSQPDPLLFGPNSLTDSLRNNEERMLREIDAIDGDEFLNTSADALCDYFVERFKVEPRSSGTATSRWTVRARSS